MLAPIVGIVEAAFGVVVAVVAGGEDTHGKALVREVDWLFEILFSLGQPLDVVVVEKIVGVEHLPGLSAVEAACELAFLYAGDVVAVALVKVALGKTDKKLVVPLPRAVVGGPTVKAVVFDSGYYVLDVGGLLGVGGVAESQ